MHCRLLKEFVIARVKISCTTSHVLTNRWCPRVKMRKKGRSHLSQTLIVTLVNLLSSSNSKHTLSFNDAINEACLMLISL